MCTYLGGNFDPIFLKHNNNIGTTECALAEGLLGKGEPPFEGTQIFHHSLLIRLTMLRSSIISHLDDAIREF